MVKSKNKIRKSHLVRNTILFMFGIIFLIIFGLGASFYHRTKIDINKTYAPLKSKLTKSETNLDLKKKKSVSFLIMGLDSRQNDLSGRTDALMIVTINPKDKRATVLSIPRDTFIGENEAEANSLDKINAAYDKGGVEELINDVNKLINIKIDHYIALDFEAFKQIIDDLGGITVDSNIAFETDGSKFYEGKNVISGKEALAYTRMRYEDPTGTYGRDKRQQQVVEALLTKIKSGRSIGVYFDIIDSLGENMKTDLNWDQVKTLLFNYSSSFGKVSHEVLQGHTKTINGFSFQIISTQERERAHKVLSEQLNH